MLRFLSALAVTATFVAQASAADFVGSEACRSCHLEAYEQWRNGPHARAHLSLSTTEARDPKCVQCHAPDTEKGGDPGVSCESCHGAGEYYSADYVMRDPELARATGLQLPKPADCLLCHDAASPSLQSFDPAKKLQEIDHWTGPREARQKKNASAAPCELPTRAAIARLARDLRPKGTHTQASNASANGTPSAESSPKPTGSEAPKTVRTARASSHP